MHTSLAVSWDEARDPLGVVAMETWTRGRKKKGSAWKRRTDPSRESQRWHRAVQEVGKLADIKRFVHVMDREADAYDLLATMISRGERFVVRATFDRRVAGSDEAMSEVLASQPIVVTRNVPLSSRTKAQLPKQRKIHPPRGHRLAQLGIKAATIELNRPKGQPASLQAQLRVHLVGVEEIAPPAGEPPVRWWLFTSESIDTALQLERIVDAYRCRWRIEEFFKALKTGCAIEKRQLETYVALVNALAVYIPIAWRMLRHRSLAHNGGNAPALTILTLLQLRLLRKSSRRSLPAKPTVKDALTAIAAMGGHLKRNRPPGWITLGRGYERLLAMEDGARLVLEK